MSTRYEQYGRDDAFEEGAAESPDREISLGTTTVLGIFVALTLVCALFFGFGYSMGRRSTPPILSSVDPHVSAPVNLAPDADAAPVLTQSSPDDTPPGRSPAHPETPGASTAMTVPRTPAAKPSASLSSTTPDRAAFAAGKAPPRPSAAATSDAAADKIVPVGSAATAEAPTPATAKPTSGAAQSYVQVAAISHKEDADLLLASLKRRGYAAVIRQQPQDNLLHIQIGPLASKKDADVMRQKLLTDGYNAIVK